MRAGLRFTLSELQYGDHFLNSPGSPEDHVSSIQDLQNFSGFTFISDSNRKDKNL